MNSLVASTHVLIPIEPDGLSLIGLADILRMIEGVHKNTNPDLKILGIIPSRFRMIRRQSRDVIEDMERMYGHLLLPYIKDLAEISAATTAGYDIFHIVRRNPRRTAVFPIWWMRSWESWGRLSLSGVNGKETHLCPWAQFGWRKSRKGI